MSKDLSTPLRFYSLDVLRGVAALSVVLWHWQHFFHPLNKNSITFYPTKQPLYDLLFLFYKNGATAVQLFFCISGFIFYWLYATRIRSNLVDFKLFSILRISRLYPLHVLTLVFVAIVQILHIHIASTPFVYLHNDGYHFILNLLFASSWGFETGYSFNGPIWSVSIEILLYITFYFLCKLIPKNVLALLTAVVVFYLIQNFNKNIGRGGISFFMGGLCFLMYEEIIKKQTFKKYTYLFSVQTILLWACTIIYVHSNYDLAHEEAHWIVHKIIQYFNMLILFPTTVLCLALVETYKGDLGKNFAFIGDISYSSYLLHFPLQLLTALLFHLF